MTNDWVSLRSTAAPSNSTPVVKEHSSLKIIDLIRQVARVFSCKTLNSGLKMANATTRCRSRNTGNRTIAPVWTPVVVRSPEMQVAFGLCDKFTNVVRVDLLKDCAYCT